MKISISTALRTPFFLDLLTVMEHFITVVFLQKETKKVTPFSSHCESGFLNPLEWDTPPSGFSKKFKLWIFFASKVWSRMDGCQLFARSRGRKLAKWFLCRVKCHRNRQQVLQNRNNKIGYLSFPSSIFWSDFAVFFTAALFCQYLLKCLCW